MEGYHQVKLFCGLNSQTSEIDGIQIHFGQGHDSKYGDETINQIPENGIGIRNRGFSSLSQIQEFNQKEKQYFILRINNNISQKMEENGQVLLGKGQKQVEARVVDFCDLAHRKRYCLVTNLREEQMSQEEVAEIYRHRWAIETLWKFLKMHLKLDRLMTKNEPGIRLQIYSCLMVYVILQLVEVSEEVGHKTLDKLRYLQAFMNEKISYIHWFRQMSFSW